MLTMEALLEEARLPKRVRTRAKTLLEESGAELVAALIDRLPEKQRVALALRYYESLRPEEIAAVLDLDVSSVKELLCSATESLSEGIRDAHDTQTKQARKTKSKGRR